MVTLGIGVLWGVPGAKKPFEAGLKAAEDSGKASLPFSTALTPHYLGCLPQPNICLL